MSVTHLRRDTIIVRWGIRNPQKTLTPCRRRVLEEKNRWFASGRGMASPSYQGRIDHLINDKGGGVIHAGNKVHESIRHRCNRTWGHLALAE